MYDKALHDSYCDDHSKLIRVAVDNYGMEHLVWAYVGRKDERGEKFNPIAIADTALVMRGTKLWGLRSILANPEGTARCVCCEADRRFGSGAGARWIREIMECVRIIAGRQGLLNRPVNRVQFSLVT